MSYSNYLNLNWLSWNACIFHKKTSSFTEDILLAIEEYSTVAFEKKRFHFCEVSTKEVFFLDLSAWTVGNSGD